MCLTLLWLYSLTLPTLSALFSGNASTMRFRDNQDTTHHLPCSKGGQQGDGLKTIRFAVTVHPSISRVCEGHLDCKVMGICDDIFIVGSLSDSFSCAAELKQIQKVDLDMVLNVSKFILYFPDPCLNLEKDLCTFERTFIPSVSDLADMGAGLSTDSMRVAGVQAGIDNWVKAFDAKKAWADVTDVAKIGCCHGWAHSHTTTEFCKSTCMEFLGRKTPTPLLPEFMAQVDDIILEAVWRNGTGEGHVDQTPHLRKFANMNIHCPTLFGITPNQGSAISAFYAATCAHIVWLGSHGGTLPALQIADSWAPGQDLTSPES